MYRSLSQGHIEKRWTFLVFYSYCNNQNHTFYPELIFPSNWKIIMANHSVRGKHRFSWFLATWLIFLFLNMCEVVQISNNMDSWRMDRLFPATLSPRGDIKTWLRNIFLMQICRQVGGASLHVNINSREQSKDITDSHIMVCLLSPPYCCWQNVQHCRQ